MLALGKADLVWGECAGKVHMVECVYMITGYSLLFGRAHRLAQTDDAMQPLKVD